MTLEDVLLQPLERAYLQVLRIRAAIGWLIVLAIATAADTLVQARFGLAFGWITGLALAFAVGSVVFQVPRRWRRWGYAFTERELHVAQGWLFQIHTVVPVSRVQHIDLSQGPIERALGVAALTLHTAGTEASLVRLPGLSRHRAEEIRDAIRGRISDAPW